MPCTDRQLTPAQIEAGFQNQRTGVARGIRPFTGDPTPENIADYLNREVYPLLKAAREKINDTYLQVTDNAPSGNPLSYYFSTNTANADPTAGFIRLDNATQDSATTIRVSQNNSRLVNTAPWLDVMAGSATTPLGAVTLTDAINPGRFVRWDLLSMTDQGAYWDLVVSPIESSSDNPFVNGNGVVLAFIPGVASSGAGGAVGGPRRIQITSMAAAVTQSLNNATNSVLSSGTIFVPELTASITEFSINNVNFRASGQSLLAVARFPLRAGTLAAQAYDISFSNSGNVSFGQVTSTFAGIGRMNIITASATVAATSATLALADFHAAVGTNITGYSTATSLALGSVRLQLMTETNVPRQNVSFALSSNSLVAAAEIDVFGLPGADFAPGLSFANSNGFSFSITSTLAAASLKLVRVVGDYAGARGVAVPGSTLTNGTIVFSNSNGVSFGLNGSTMTGSYAREIGLVSHVGGQSVASVTRLAFSNASDVTFSLSTAANAATLFASISTQSVPTHTLAIAANGGAAISNGTFAFSDSNGVSFGRNASTMTLSFDGVRRVVGGVNAFNGRSELSFSDSNNVSFGATSAGAGNVAITAQAFFLASHIAGNAASVTRLAFSNASNVTFSLSTAASAATLIASVATAAGGGGIAAAAGTQTGTSGTILWGNANNVTFGMNGSTQITASASFPALVLTGVVNGGGPGTFSSGTVGFNGSSTVRGDRSVTMQFSSNTVIAGFEAAVGGFRNTVTGGGTPIGLSLCHNRPFFFEPFEDGVPLYGFGANNAIGDWRLGHTGNITGTATSQQGQSYNWTYKLGLYMLDGDTGSRLTLVNSASFSNSRASGASVQSALHGSRWVRWVQTNWSVSSGLSSGQYWLAFMISQNTSNDARASLICANALNMGQGIVGQDLTSNGSVRNHPFGGFFTVTTAAFPATVASAAVFTNTSASLGRFIPAVSVRPLMNAAFD